MCVRVRRWFPVNSLVSLYPIACRISRITYVHGHHSRDHNDASTFYFQVPHTPLVGKSLRGALPRRPLKKHQHSSGKRAWPRKDFRPAVSPYVARKAHRVSHETSTHFTPEMVFCGFARRAEYFSRDVRTYHWTEVLTWPCPFSFRIPLFLEGAGVGGPT